MPCTRPLDAWKLNGKVIFERPASAEGVSVQVTLPCGGCIGCRLMHAQEWATRIKHEAKMHQENSFLTLTYANEHLPQFGSLNYPDFQAFMKSLRQALRPKKLRFFMCGEYGDTTKRAHYHCILFGWMPQDGTVFTESRSGNTIYNSEFLAKHWRLGHINFSVFEPGAAEYIARYVTKKITGEPASKHYLGLDTETGEIGPRKPEFAIMSRRPGIGATWFDQYFDTDIDPFDSVTAEGGATSKVPRYYDKLTAKRYGESVVKRKKRLRVQSAKEKSKRDTRSLIYGREATAANHNARLGQMKRETF